MATFPLSCVEPNFYKAISAVDILTFVSMLQTAKMSGFAPDRTPESSKLAGRYLQLEELSRSWNEG